MFTRKNLLKVLIPLLLLAFIVGCSNNKESDNGVLEEANDYVKVSEIEFVGSKINEPDSIGNRYFEAQIKNNSKYKIVGFNVEFELDNGESSYFSTYDTILPGETSTKATCFGATTGNLADMKAKKITITMLDNEDRYLYVDYDVKLDKYDILKGEKEEEVKAPISVEEIEFVNPGVLEPDSVGNIYYETQLKNNSSSTITGISIEYELDNGETAYLSTYDTLLPGDTSTKASCFGSTTGKVEDMKIKKISIRALDKEQNEIYIDYDAKLDKYEIIKAVN